VVPHCGPARSVRESVGRHGSMKPEGAGAVDRVSTTRAIACCWRGSERHARKRRKVRQVLYLLPELSATSVCSSPHQRTPRVAGEWYDPKPYRALNPARRS
jgi:hypothetical protein